jgi:hypothetical protein
VALEALKCGPSKASKNAFFWSKIDWILKKNPNFGPQNGDFSKMWPSSRFGLAMAGLLIVNC